MKMMLPYHEPLVPREPAERQIPEPPRRGEPGGTLRDLQSKDDRSRVVR
jgi:hypothetical protein